MTTFLGRIISDKTFESERKGEEKNGIRKICLKSFRLNRSLKTRNYVNFEGTRVKSNANLNIVCVFLFYFFRVWIHKQFILCGNKKAFLMKI